MVKAKKDDIAEEVKKVEISPCDVEWTDHVLGFLNDDEKIAGNPTTDGLRRIFEKVLNCRLIRSTSTVSQSPSVDNERRATVIHSLTYRLNPQSPDPEGINTLTTDGSADVYWGNCDKIYRNHPVAVAETRAEGRALRRALKLRKVVAAEEIAKDIDTEHLEQNNLNKINNSQINFFDVFGQRLNISIPKLLKSMNIDYKTIYDIDYDNAVKIISTLSSFQQNNNIPENIKGYDSGWKN